MDITLKLRDGRTDLVMDLVKNNHDPFTFKTGGATMMQWCAYYGDLSAIKYLEGLGVGLDSLGPNYDLNGAAFHGHWQLCQYLLEQGADPNHSIKGTGETALHAATSKAGNLNAEYIVRALLHNGANPNHPTTPGFETGAFMRDVKTRGETALHRAAAFSSFRTIEALLDGGADKELKDAYGDSPLSWASWYKRPDYILELLVYGKFKIHLERVQISKDQIYSGSDGLNYFLKGKVHL